MALDTGIYSQLQPNLAMGMGDIVNKFVDQGQADQERRNRLVQLAQAGQLQNLQLQQAQQQQEDVNATRQAMAASGGDISQAIPQLQQSGAWQQAAALMKQQKDMQTQNMELAQKRIDAIHGVMQQISTSDPSKASDIINNAVSMGALHPQDAANVQKDLSTLPPDQIPAYAQQKSVTAKDASTQIAKGIYAKPDWRLVETESGQQFVNLNDPNTKLKFGPKPSSVLQEMGKPPAGYRKTASGDLEAIPGGPADLKQQGAFNQDVAALQGANTGFDRLATAANELLNHPGLERITGKMGALPNIPGGEAADAEAKLNTLKSQVGFGVLQDMRNNSKTGGALGSVSDAEGKRLEANLAALEKAQSTEQFKESLKKIIDYAEQAKGRMDNAFNMKHGGGATSTPSRYGNPENIVKSSPSISAPKIGTIEDGHIFLGGDPSDPKSWKAK